MGERLNIEIHEDGEVLANAYYHWGGFTKFSLELLEIILNNVGNVNYDNRIVNAIKLLETTGAGLNPREMIYAKTFIKDFNKYRFKEAKDRNLGLISVSRLGILDTRYWEDENIIIDLKKQKFDFNVFSIYTKKVYEEDYLEEEEFPLYSELPIYDIKFNNIPFNDFKKFKEQILEVLDNAYLSIYKNSNGEVIFLIT